MAAKKKASAKRRVKKAAAKRPAKKAAKRVVKKSSKRAPKKAAAKRPAKRSSKKASSRNDLSKIVIPPVPTRGATSVSSTPAPAKSASAPAAQTPAKKSNNVLFLVIAGVVLLAIFALTNSSSDDDDAAPTPTETVSEEPSAEPSESESEEPAITAYEAPTGFVAIRNASGGVTLRWKAPAASDGLTGYAVSVSYNAVDFVEVSTVGADQLSFDIALASDEGGTQFLLQSVYSDGTKVDAAKFSL
ncbi:MAG: hypothetical protein EBU38_01370, partial [Actinobacteria bacterium]|nr:hypothetical protein [Actinomycetota bacterium]